MSVAPHGDVYYVFRAGVPAFRKYAPSGQLLFERHIEGPELDAAIQQLPTTWPRSRSESGRELPLVPPMVRAAAVDSAGNLWVSLAVPFTYVYSPQGDRIRVVQFRAAGIEKLKLDVDVQINLYRMLQEGLNNIDKHAEATEAAVKLTAAHPSILLRIEDNGKGFDVEKRAREIDSEKRMGLRSLQERTELLGGIMIVTSTPGRGTRILIKFPHRG